MADLKDLMAAQVTNPTDSNSALFTKLLIGLAPTLVGAAIGGARGGAIGSEAGITGTKLLASQEEKAKEEEAAKAKFAAEKMTNAEELALKKAELGLKQRELGIKEARVGQEKGKPVTAEQAKLVASLDTSEQQLSEIEKEIEKNADVMGPIAGRVAPLSPYASQTKGFDARMKLAAQKIGVALEGGKLTDQDIDRYRQMLPSLTDAPETAKAKVQVVRQLLQQEKESQLGSMKAGGYEVSKYSEAKPKMMPQQMPQPAGGMPQAIAAEKPRVVVQGGNTYVLNPVTGQYE